MRDPFNFADLRRHAPKYLGMDSIRDALADTSTTEVEDLSMEDQFSAPADSTDQIMPDQVMPDQLAPEHVYVAGSDDSAPCSDTNDALGTANNKSSSHSTAYRNSSVGGFTDEGSMKHTIRPYEETDAQSHKAKSESVASIWREPQNEQLLQKVMDPTQAGAQMAVAPRSNQVVNRTNYPTHHVEMPIPLPWQENLSYTFSTYLQLIFNLGVLVLAGWISYIVQRDVGRKIIERKSELVREAHWCQEQYITNNCRTGRAAPHLVETRECLRLEACMDADPEHIRWLTMYASLLAEVMNELVVPLQMRTILAFLGVGAMVILVIVANYWFGFWRAKAFFLQDDKSRMEHKHALQSTAMRSHTPLSYGSELYQHGFYDERQFFPQQLSSTHLEHPE